MAFSGLFSSFFPRTIFKCSSPLSGEICVVQKGLERQLCVNGVCQSINYDAPGVERRYWGQVYFQMRSVLEQSAAGSPAAKSRKALILGLGGGTVVRLLLQEFPEMKIDAVEIDPEIIKVANRFFGLDQLPNLRVVCADAFDVVSSPLAYNLDPAGYELVLVDTYCGSQFPPKFSRRDFFHAVSKILTPSGTAVFNRVFHRSNPRLLKDFTETIGEVFVKVLCMEVPGPSGFSNLLIFAEAR